MGRSIGKNPCLNRLYVSGKQQYYPIYVKLFYKRMHRSILAIFFEKIIKDQSSVECFGRLFLILYRGGFG